MRYYFLTTTFGERAALAIEREGRRFENAISLERRRLDMIREFYERDRKAQRRIDLLVAKVVRA